MKRLYLAVLILAGLLAGSLLSAGWVGELTDSCRTRLFEAQALAERGEWAQARAVTQEVAQAWEDREFALYALMHHDEVDEIVLSLETVREYLEAEEAGRYAAANAALMEQLRLLAEMERPSLENVL